MGRLLRVAVAGLCALGAMPAAPAATPRGGSVLAAGRGALSFDRLVELNGSEVPSAVSVTTHTASGPVTVSMGAARFREALEALSGGGSPTESVCLQVTCSPDAGRGTPGGQFCDNASGWVLFTGAPGGTTIQAASSSGPSSLVTCNGAFGPTQNWDYLWLNPRRVATPATVSSTGCWATLWVVAGSGYCPGAQGGQGFLTSFLANGPGVLFTATFGSLSLDYFAGNTAQVAYS